MKRSLLALAFCLLGTSSSTAYDAKQFVGTYTSNEQGFTHLKTLTIKQADDGSIKVSATLAGYPDDLYLGEAKADVYSSNTSQITLLATVTDGKITDTMTIRPWGNNAQVVSLLKYKNGRANECLDGTLAKQ
jgi:hypothetical protein